jgi:hypothetical protein
MQDRFADYRLLYSGADFELACPAIEYAKPYERAVFWLGAANQPLSKDDKLSLSTRFL